MAEIAATSDVAEHGVLIICTGAPDIPHEPMKISRLRAGRFAVRRSRTTVWHNAAGRPTWTLTCPVRGCRQHASVNGDTAQLLFRFLQAHPELAGNTGYSAISLRFLNKLLTKTDLMR